MGVGICDWRVQVQDTLDRRCLRISGRVVRDIGQQKAVPIWRSLSERGIVESGIGARRCSELFACTEGVGGVSVVSWGRVQPNFKVDTVARLLLAPALSRQFQFRGLWR